MKQNNGYLSVTQGRMTVICQLYEAGWWLSISYMRQDGGYLSAMQKTANLIQVT
jgi:DNA topoisomerase IA